MPWAFPGLPGLPEGGKRNVYNNLLRIITSAHLFDKLPFPSEMADKNTGQLKDNSPRHIVLDLQD